jgi:hypothetical protein
LLRYKKYKRRSEGCFYCSLRRLVVITPSDGQLFSRITMLQMWPGHFTVSGTVFSHFTGRAKWGMRESSSSMEQVLVHSLTDKLWSQCLVRFERQNYVLTAAWAELGLSESISTPATANRTKNKKDQLKSVDRFYSQNIVFITCNLPETIGNVQHIRGWMYVVV